MRGRKDRPTDHGGPSRRKVPVLLYPDRLWTHHLAIQLLLRYRHCPQATCRDHHVTIYLRSQSRLRLVSHALDLTSFSSGSQSRMNGSPWRVSLASPDSKAYIGHPSPTPSLQVMWPTIFRRGYRSKCLRSHNGLENMWADIVLSPLVRTIPTALPW